MTSILFAIFVDNTHSLLLFQTLINDLTFTIYCLFKNKRDLFQSASCKGTVASQVFFMIERGHRSMVEGKILIYRRAVAIGTASEPS